MAKLERELNYDFDELLHRIEKRLPQSHWL
jgi:hypothetical protein